MITGNQCTTDFYKFLKGKIEEAAEKEGAETWLSEVQVYKDDDKPDSYKGQYFAINCLPLSYGYSVNTQNVMNVNLHSPKLSSGSADRIKLNKMLDFFAGIVPLSEDVEDCDTLMIEGVYYSISSISNPLEDKDGTYFLNIRLSLTF